MKEAERRQTLGTTAASCDAARALLERARLTAFHHGSHLRELFHPKGSASGQASWDVVCTGVNRQVHLVTFERKDHKLLQAIVLSDASSEECSMGDAQVFVISQTLGTAPKAPY